MFGNAEVEVSKAKALEIVKELLKTNVLYLLVKVCVCARVCADLHAQLCVLAHLKSDAHV